MYIAKVIWGVLCVTVFVVAALSYEPNTDAGDMVLVAMITIMAVLSFPSGMIAWFGFMAVLLLLFSILDMFVSCCPRTSILPAASEWTLFVLSWLVAFVAGYVQWFWLLPRLREKSKVPKRVAHGGEA